MTLKRLDAIATGVLALIAGGILIYGMAGSFGEQVNQMRRQEEVLGTVVGQEKTKVCRQQKRGELFKCVRWEQEQCPVVQYQPSGGDVLTRKDCGLPLSNWMQVYVRYDSKVPTDARIALEAGENYDWVPLLLTGIPLGLGGFLLLLGCDRLWQGFHWKE